MEDLRSLKWPAVLTEGLEKFKSITTEHLMGTPSVAGGAHFQAVLTHTVADYQGSASFFFFDNEAHFCVEMLSRDLHLRTFSVMTATLKRSTFHGSVVFTHNTRCRQHDATTIPLPAVALKRARNYFHTHTHRLTVIRRDHTILLPFCFGQRIRSPAQRHHGLTRTNKFPPPGSRYTPHTPHHFPPMYGVMSCAGAT